MSEDGIDTIHPLGNSHLNWKSAHSTTVNADGVLLMLSSHAGLWLPDVALAAGTPDQVRQLVAATVRAPGAKG